MIIILIITIVIIIMDCCLIWTECASDAVTQSKQGRPRKLEKNALIIIIVRINTNIITIIKKLGAY